MHWDRSLLIRAPKTNPPTCGGDAPMFRDNGIMITYYSVVAVRITSSDNRYLKTFQLNLIGYIMSLVVRLGGGEILRSVFASNYL